MTDDGTALGAALQVAHDIKPISQSRLSTVYLGPKYPSHEVKKLIKKHSIKVIQSSNVEELLAEYLAEGKVVAIFQGAMEFGPRSLGNRSILASADEKEY